MDIQGICERLTENTPCPYCGRGIDDPGHSGSALSWNGFVVCGNRKSIDKIKSALHSEQYIEDFRKRMNTLTALVSSAQAERDQARAEVARLREALQPFADEWTQHWSAADYWMDNENIDRDHEILVRHLRAARTALAETAPAPGDTP